MGKYFRTGAGRVSEWDRINPLPPEVVRFVERPGIYDVLG